MLTKREIGFVLLGIPVLSFFMLVLFASLHIILEGAMK